MNKVDSLLRSSLPLKLVRRRFIKSSYNPRPFTVERGVHRQHTCCSFTNSAAAAAYALSSLSYSVSNRVHSQQFNPRSFLVRVAQKNVKHRSRCVHRRIPEVSLLGNVFNLNITPFFLQILSDETAVAVVRFLLAAEKTASIKDLF